MLKSNPPKNCFSVFFSVDKIPLRGWATRIQNGYVKRVFDEDIMSMVLEVQGSNVPTVFITSPREPKNSLGIKLPFLILLVKNLHKYFTFEVKILDDQKHFRHFRISNFQNKTAINPLCTSMPMGMSPGWNQIHFNLADFTRRTFATNYVETVRLQIHANIRIRRIFFSDRLYADEDLPDDFRLICKQNENNAPCLPASNATNLDPPNSFANDHKKNCFC